MYFLVTIVFLFFTLGLLIGKSLACMKSKGKIIIRDYMAPVVMADLEELKNSKSGFFEIINE